MPYVIRPKSFRKLAVALIGAAAIGAGMAQPAAASGCPVTPVTNPFAPWGDLADYSLIPNGDLESGAAGWTLRGATVEAGNAPFLVGSPTDTQSLKIRNGGVAVSPAFCVGAEHPTFRFFAHQPRGSNAPDVKVYVRFGSGTRLKDQQVDTLAGSRYYNWRPSNSVDLFEKLGLGSGATTTARFVFEVEDESGDQPWRIDDVYLDPYRR
jgi:hypothetical protein